jgi:hypothetical protein
MLLPVGWRALSIVTLQAGGIVLAIIAKHGATSIELTAVPDKNIPKVMTDLMPEMAERRAVRFGQFRPASLALDAIGLRKGDRDEAILMAGHDLRSCGRGRVGQEFKGQPVVGIFSAGFQRQLPTEQAVEQTMLGEFEFAPCRKSCWGRDVCDRAVVSACDAKVFLRARWRQPVAGVMRRIRAEAAGGAVSGQGRPVLIACGL